MNISEFLAPADVIVGLRAGNKGDLIRELARRATPVTGIEPAVIANALQARELLGSTGLGRGFALPHARIPGLARFFGTFARLARPIDFQAIDDSPVDLVFLLLIPADAENEHVAALAAISRRLRNAEVLRGVRKADSPATLHALITAGQA
jgi:PTS system nitrogen regulatory IIA component